MLVSSPLSRRSLVIGALSALGVLAIWTTFILVGRASATRSLSPLDIAWLRFAGAGAGAIALPLLMWRGRTLMARLGGGRVALKRISALAATAGFGYCTLAYSGFFFAPAAHGAVLMPGTLPLWTALLALLVLGERIGRWRIAGLALILLGGALVGGSSLWAAATGADGSGTWRGDLLFVCAAVTWATYGVLCRRWRVGALDATMAIAAGCLVVAVPVYPILVAGFGLGSLLTTAPWHEIAFHAAFQGVVAMWIAGLCFTQVVATFGPVRTTMLTSLVPPTAALLAVPLIGEPLQVAALWGLACVTLGLLLGLRQATVASTVPAPVVTAT
jgi:drug/metabolite transporter (DMT)-like permease